MRARIILGLASVSLCGFLLSSASAQDAEEIVELSPFTVQSDRDIGYYASSAISATRVNAPLIQLPISINVVTSGFIEDTAAHTIEDALEFTSGVNPNGFGNSNFAVRGFTAGTASRDGMVGIGGNEIPTSAIERIEVVKGPAALLYGQGTAGGVVNYTTKKPISAKTGRVSFFVGSWSQFRTEFDFTGTAEGINLGDDWQLLYRFAGHLLDRESWLDNAGVDDYAIHPSLSFIHKNNTRIDIQYSYQRRTDWGHPEAVAAARQVPITDPAFANRVDINRLQSELPPEVFNNLRASPGYFATIWDSYNPNPPGAQIAKDSQTYTLTFQHDFNENASIRSVAAYYDHRNFNYQRIGSQENAPGFVSQQGALRWVSDRNYNVQTDFTYRSDLGEGMSHQLVLGHLYIDTANKFELYRDTGLSFPIHRPPVFPDDYFLGPFDAHSRGDVSIVEFGWNGNGNPTQATLSGTDFNFFVRNRFRDRSRHALYALDMLKFMDEKITVMAGLRVENIDGDFVEDLKTPFFDGESLIRSTPSTTESSQNLGQFAISFSPNENFTVYAMASESFQPNNAFPNDPQEGEGLDVGIKFSSMEGRLTGRAAYFDIDLTNVQRNDLSNPDPNLRGDAILTKGEASKGIEVDIYYTPIDRAQIIFSYANIDSEVVDNPQFPDLVGAPLVNTPENEFNLFGTYRFSDDANQGLRIGGGLSYRDEMRTFPSGTRRHIYNPEIERIDIFADYTQQLSDGRSIQYKINLKNVGDDLHVLSQKWAPRFNWLASVTYKF